MKNTAVDKYMVRGIPVLVKRDDLSFPPPAPPFSKCRGIFAHFRKLRQKGIFTVGYTETAISMAGWGVAWAAKELGMNAIIFDPQYKQPGDILLFHRQKWQEFGAKIISIPSGMAAVNFHISKKILKQQYKDAIMLPLGLPFEESISQTAKEAYWTMENLSTTPHSIVVNVGSGTIASGVLLGVEQFLQKVAGEIIIYGVMGRTGNIANKQKVVYNKAGICPTNFFPTKTKFILIDPGWSYMNYSEAECPFPCHPYYDLKAWEWLVSNINKINNPVLFWNIGGNPL
jgi:1-aminocyclopropane-1-carboxylate deaminase/D-cysteine desulfhydrase-like pyridoxal-dependent ACC family enzyme